MKIYHIYLSTCKECFKILNFYYECILKDSSENKIVHFLYYAIFSLGLLCYAIFFLKLSMMSLSTPWRFLHIKILFKIQNGHCLLYYIKMFSKGFYYEHNTCMLIACIEIAFSKNGKGEVHAMCIKPAFYVLL